MRRELNQKELSSLVSLSKRLNKMAIRFNKNDIALGNGETVSICLDRTANALDTILENHTKAL